MAVERATGVKCRLWRISSSSRWSRTRRWSVEEDEGERGEKEGGRGEGGRRRIRRMHSTARSLSADCAGAACG
jgi:hypothetical protein